MIETIVQHLADINSSLIIIVIASLAGSYGKDYLRIMKSDRPEKVSLPNVLLSTVMAVTFMYSISDFVIDKFGEKVLAFASIVSGLMGFWMMEKCSTIEGVLSFVRVIVRIYEALTNAGKGNGGEQDVLEKPKSDRRQQSAGSK